MPVSSTKVHNRSGAFTIYNLQLLISAICGTAIFTIYNSAWTFVSARLNRSVWGKGAGPRGAAFGCAVVFLGERAFFWGVSVRF